LSKGEHGRLGYGLGKGKRYLPTPGGGLPRCLLLRGGKGGSSLKDQGLNESIEEVHRDLTGGGGDERKVNRGIRDVAGRTVEQRNWKKPHISAKAGG